MQIKRSKNPIITVVRDPDHFLGKRFDTNPDGSISKSSNVRLSFGIAVQHHVPTHDALVKLLNSVGDDPHAAIINASFDGIEVGEKFVILSEKETEKRLGIATGDRKRQQGVHTIEYNGKPIKAVGRFKENVRPSNWQLLDRDVDSHTPEKYVDLTAEAWLSTLASIIPGVDKVSYVETPSSSSRVNREGKPVGQGNGHIWVYANDPDDIDRFRSGIIILAAQADMTWLKPRYSSTEEDKVVGNSLTTIVDPSVFTPGRLVFDGQPTASSEFTVMPLNAVVHQGEHEALDTAAANLPDPKTIKEITRKAGVEMNVRMGSKGLKVTANDLTLDSEIETKQYGIVAVRELIKLGATEKIRCQTPFRASESWAAFYSVNPDGIPFVYDNGTSTTHWLNEFEVDEAKVIPAATTIERLMPKIKEDAAAVLEEAPVNALATIKALKPAQYQRTRNVLKQANNGVSLTAVDRSVKARIDEINVVETHHGYAKSILAELTEDDWRPVGYHGSLYVLTPNTGLWKALPVEALIRLVAEMHDNKENCSRSSDYRAIAEHAISLASDDSFFIDAPNGLACLGGFYQIIENEITLVPLAPEHRQRVMLGFTPMEMPTPLFDKFLNETFASVHEGEEAQQIALLQEIVGGIMLGILFKQQTAILFYEPFGRAGKGTLERQIRSLVPTDFVSAVSPFRWNQDYHVATLAAKRLNVVGELPESEPIPASAFKSVIGGDLVTGRHPTHRPITFFNEAAHLFMSNHLITTKDQSEAFFARWKIVEFPNSRLRLNLPLDENLAQRIIQNELPGIGFWAMEGAVRLLRNGKLSPSTAHDRLMAKWRRSTNTLEEFIHETCELASEATYRRSDLYQDYIGWCSDNGRKPFSKGRVKELLEHNIGMGIRLVELNGHETFRGVCAKAKPTSRGYSASTPKTQPQQAAPVSDDDITSLPGMPEGDF
jgi:putative DNA primase/helicase